MEHNRALIQQDSLPGLNQLIQWARDDFYKKLKYFLDANVKRSPQVTKYVRGGFGFVLLSPKDKPSLLSSLIQDAFSCSYQEFVRQASRFGFRIKTKTHPNQQVILFLSREKLTSSHDEAPSESFSCSDEEDQFPQQEEIQAIQREKEEKSKSSFVKPHIILNKVQSEGHPGFSEPKKEDASIEVKLKEVQFTTPFIKQQQKQSAKLEDVCGAIGLTDRIRLERENYERCSKLIDSTIIELLQAHRGKKIEQSKQALMQRVVGIYDLLSNSIQNSNGLDRMFVDPQHKQEDRNDEE